MFGDMGHGLLLTTIGLIFRFFKCNLGAMLLCFQEKIKYKPGGSLLFPLYSARYLIFFMGLFAFFCGLSYNDFVSISPNLFGSCYTVNDVYFLLYLKTYSKRIILSLSSKIALIHLE